AYARSGDVHVAYHVIGDGPVDLVVSSGAITNLEVMWESPEYRRFYERLGSFARVLLFDKRGMGLSDRVRLGTLEERMDDVRAVMDAAGSDSAALMGIAFEIGVRSVVPSVNVRTLIIRREGDHVCQVGNARWLAQHIGGAKYVELPGEDHVPWVDGDEIVAEIQEFLTGVREPSE